MKIIERLSEMIDEELDDAIKYAKCAIHNEDDDELARTFRLLGNEELVHAMKLHEQVTRIIKKYNDEHGAPPDKMLAVYEYLHQRFVDKYSDARVLLS